MKEKNASTTHSLIMIALLAALLSSLLLSGCVVKYKKEEIVKQPSETTEKEPATTGPEPQDTGPIIEEIKEEDVEQGAIIPAGTDICTGTPKDDSLLCTDEDQDGQISREAIETLGKITDSKKTKFFDGNKFFLEIDDQKYKITLAQKSTSEFRLDDIPEEEVGLCGLQFEMIDDLWVLKFNPGSSHKKFSDVEHCLDECDVEKESPDQPDFDQQSCILDCGIEVCQS